jgi:hypothetical protein
VWTGWIRGALKQEGILSDAVKFLPTVAFSLGLPVTAASQYLVGGTAVDSRCHATLANARVTLAPTTARDRKSEQVTKADGRFAFTVADPGKYTLHITKPGYPTQAYRQPSFSGVSSAVVVRDDQDTRNIVFEASHGAVIAGRITDKEAEPVAAALVAVLQSAG